MSGGKSRVLSIMFEWSPVFNIGIPRHCGVDVCLLFHWLGRYSLLISLGVITKPYRDQAMPNLSPEVGEWRANVTKHRAFHRYEAAIPSRPEVPSFYASFALLIIISDRNPREIGFDGKEGIPWRTKRALWVRGRNGKVGDCEGGHCMKHEQAPCGLSRQNILSAGVTRPMFMVRISMIKPRS